jgi:hypothetical protein
MLKRIVFLFASFLALEAQQVVTPTPEQVGSPRGANLDDYNITQSFELGYRHKDVGGDEGMYRSVDNWGNGLRLFGSSLSVNSKDGHGRYFDEILLNTIGLGNDNYQNAVLRVQKNGLYRYDMTWRLNAYFNPGLTVAGGTHFEDTIRRLQDHELTLLPQSRIRFRIGYSRDTEDGPSLSTAQEFDVNGSGLPVFVNVKRHWNEYRVGADVDLAGFKFTLLHRWDFFKDDSPATSAGVVAAGTATDQTVLQQFSRSQPVHGSNPGWLGNLFTRRKLWGMNARITYNSGNNDFALVEAASGTGQFGGPANRQIVVGGSARRPMLAGDFSISLYPGERLTLVNNTSVFSNRIDGDSTYSEVLTGANFGTTLNFRYLGIRTVTNSTDANYSASRWLGLFAGYEYSDRLVRTIEGSEIPGLAGTSASDLYEVSNHLNTGRAGFRLRPVKPFTITLGGEVGRAANPLTPVSERNYHALNGRLDYRTRKLQLNGIYRQAYNLNAPVSFQSFSSHSRQYGVNASWSPNGWFSIDAAYNKLHLDTASALAFFAGTGIRSQLQTGYSSLFRSNIHAGNLGARFEILKRASLYVGYSITRDTGDGRAAPTTDPIQTLLNSVQTFPLTYQTPLARLSIRITPKIRWNAGWQFYDYAEDTHLFNANQNYHAHVSFTSVLWSF